MKNIILLLFSVLHFSVNAYTGKSLFSQSTKNDIIDRYIIERINEQVDRNDFLSAQKRYSEVNYLIDARNVLMQSAVVLTSSFKTSTNHFLNQQQGDFQNGKTYACYVLLTSEQSSYSDHQIIEMLEYLNSKERLNDINLQTVEELERLYYKNGGANDTILPPPRSGQMATDSHVNDNPRILTEANIEKAKIANEEYLRRSRLGDDKHLGVLLHYHNGILVSSSGASLYTTLNLSFDTQIQEVTRFRIERALQANDFGASFQQYRSSNAKYSEYLEAMVTSNVHQLLESTMDNYLASDEAIYSTEATQIIQYVNDHTCDFIQELNTRLSDEHYAHMRAADRVMVLNLLSQSDMGGLAEDLTIKVLRKVFSSSNASSQIPIVLNGLKAPAKRRICATYSATGQAATYTESISLLAKLHSGIDNLSATDWVGEDGNYVGFVSAVSALVKSNPNTLSELSNLVGAADFETRYVNWDQERVFRDSYQADGSVTSYIKNVDFSSGKITYDYYPLYVYTDLVNSGCPGTYITQPGQSAWCYKYKFRHSGNATHVTLNPFDLVLFTSMTPNDLTNGVSDGTGDMMLVPAYFLYAMHTTEVTQNSIRASMLAIDVLGLYGGIGRLGSAVTRLGRYLILMDIASSGAGIISNAFYSSLPPGVMEVMRIFETLTGIVGLGQGTVGAGLNTIQLGRYVKSKAASIDLNGIKSGVEQCCLKINNILSDTRISLTDAARQQLTLMKEALEKKLRYYFNFTVNYLVGNISNNTVGYGKYSTRLDNSLTVLSKESLYGNTASSFLDSEYRTALTNAQVVVYRTFGDDAKIGGTFTTTIQNPTRIELALLDEWNNSMRFEATINVPQGTKLNVGKVGPQTSRNGSQKLIGGADQVILPFNWDKGWIVKVIDKTTGKVYNSATEFAADFPQLVN